MSKKRDNVNKTRLTDQERETVRQAAAHDGLSMSEYIRRRVLGRPTSPKAVKKAYKQQEEAPKGRSWASYVPRPEEWIQAELATLDPEERKDYDAEVAMALPEERDKRRSWLLEYVDDDTQAAMDAFDEEKSIYERIRAVDPAIRAAGGVLRWFDRLPFKEQTEWKGWKEALLERERHHQHSDPEHGNWMQMITGRVPMI